MAYGNGTNVLYTWSDRGDLDAHDHYFTGASVSYDFTYNGVGQKTSKTLSDPVTILVNLAPRIGKLMFYH